jgi:hypothetical protein
MGWADNRDTIEKKPWFEYYRADYPARKNEDTRGGGRFPDPAPGCLRGLPLRGAADSI